MSSPLASALLQLFSLFWCLDDKGGEESYLYHFSCVVCVMVVVDKNLLCVACKTLMACITLYNIMPIMLSLFV
jgi:hypothetical protein